MVRPRAFRSTEEARRVALVHRPHAAMISLEERTIVGELLANAEVFGCHRQQLGPQLFSAHVAQSPLGLAPRHQPQAVGVTAVLALASRGWTTSKPSRR
jgi:hypothetical protein